MKRIVLTSMAAAAAMLFSFSCQKEEQTGDNHGKGKILTVTATIGDVVSDTKTYIDGTEESPKTYWSEGDSIKLFDESGAYAIYCLQSGEGTSIGTFGCVEGSVSSCACAYYPADGAVSYEDGDITANIPSAQKYVAGGTGKNAGTFANGASPMVGTGTLDDTKGNLDLTFKNLFGALQLTFQSDATITSVSRIDVASAADAAFYGTLTVSPQETEEGAPSCDFETPDESWRQVSLVMDTTVELDATTGTSFYIVLPAGVNTARIGVTTNDGLYYKDVKKSVERSHIKPLAASTLSAAGFAKAEYSEATDRAAVMVESMIWAPVNCGYDAANYKYGKLYQWGRKNGCGYDDDTYKETILQETSITTIPIAAKDENETIFYQIPNEPADWLTPQDSTRWNDNKEWPGKETSPTKTNYDPCPTGWRVPTYEELKTLFGENRSPSIETVGEQQGAYFNGSSAPGSTGVFLPAAGERSCGAGEASGRNTYGNYWSSSVNGEYYDGEYAWNLFFFNSYADMNDLGCASGFSIRCIQD